MPYYNVRIDFTQIKADSEKEAAEMAIMQIEHSQFVICEVVEDGGVFDAADTVTVNRTGE